MGYVNGTALLSRLHSFQYLLAISRQGFRMDFRIADTFANGTVLESRLLLD
jgi:hypothetical protein